MSEVGASDAFTRSEATRLLVELEGIALSASAVEALVERTEGWPAGLYLAALSLRQHPDVHAGVGDFTGAHGQIVAYLSAEVLGALDPDTRGFVQRSAALGRFTAELCDAVLERSDSAVLLAGLERSNLFLASLDGRGQWFRFHALFEEVLRLELAATDPSVAGVLHRRASNWCQDRGLVAEAAQHAAAAGDHRRVAELLVEHHNTLFDHGLFRTHLRWVCTLPSEMLLEFPVLTCAAAVASGVDREPAARRRRFLALAARTRASSPQRWRPYDEAMAGIVHAAMVDRSVSEAVAWGQRAAAIAEDAADELVPPVYAAFGYACFLAGDLAGAVNAAQRAIEHHRAEQRVPAHLGAQAVLALAQAEGGHPEAAAAAATAIATDACLAKTWVAALAAAARATVLERRGDLSEAEQEAKRSARLNGGVSLAGEAWELGLLARIRCGRGRIAGGLTLVGLAMVDQQVDSET
jgi:LuxR family maltose regulon positive regulatory protein